MKLQSRLPDSIIVNGKRYKADFDFRNVLDFIETLDDSSLMPEIREYNALRCVLKRVPKDTKAALHAVRIALFPHQTQGGKKLTSFEQDADLIRAAFLQAYGINLFHAKLHWLEFASLLNALPEGSRYSEVLGIRSRPMPKPTKYNHDEREWLAKAKAAYALKLTEKEIAHNYEETVKNVFSVLMGIAQRGNESG